MTGRRGLMPKAAKRERRLGLEQEQLPEKFLFELLHAHRYREAMSFLSEVKNINAVDDQTGMTALHWAAAHCVKNLVNALWLRDDLDELARDSKGRYASELAAIQGRDEVLAEELMMREKSFGELRGIIPWPKPELP